MDKRIYFRLIALWIVCEAVLGGVLRSLKIPFSGMLVGGCSVLCISLIGFYIHRRGSIFKATMIVAIFKLMLTPHSSPMAYFAVFFQGVLGELVFANRRFYKISSLLLGVIALTETGLQRIAVMTFVFGMNLWEGINQFIYKLLGETLPINYSVGIASVYVLVHLIAGVLIGILAGNLPGLLEQWRESEQMFLIKKEDSCFFDVKKTRKKKKIKKVLWGVWVLFILLQIQSYYEIGKPILPANLSFQLLFRSVFIILTWSFLINPMVMRFLQKWLLERKKRSHVDINEIVELLPLMKNVFVFCWSKSAGLKRLPRIKRFLKSSLVNILSTQEGSLKG